MKTSASKKLHRILALALVFAFSIFPVSAAKPAPISLGLDILAKDVEMVKSGLLYSDITFTPVDFEVALGVGSIGSITVRSLPEPSDGTLKLGNKNVEAGDVIARKEISSLKFIPASSEIRESEFSFSSNHGAHAIVCTMYVLPTMNFAPTTALGDDASLSVETAKGISLFGTLYALDPENDALTFEIVTYPKNGNLTLANKNSGDYKYTPNVGYTGKDSFSYTVRDRYGNYSDITTVSIKVNKNDTEIVLADMTGHWAQGAAIKAVQSGMIDSKIIGAEAYFYPDENVSRVDFLVMVMKAVGIKDVPDCSATIFTDDDDIPQELKGYVAEALSRGYVHGSYTSKGILFDPNSNITRAEAAVMINNILDAATSTVLPAFADIGSVPAWAKSAFYSLNSLGIFKGTGGGNISPYGTITRAQAAQILAAVSELK